MSLESKAQLEKLVLLDLKDFQDLLDPLENMDLLELLDQEDLLDVRDSQELIVTICMPLTQQQQPSLDSLDHQPLLNHSTSFLLLYPLSQELDSLSLLIELQEPMSAPLTLFKFLMDPLLSMLLWELIILVVFSKLQPESPHWEIPGTS